MTRRVRFVSANVVERLGTPFVRETPERRVFNLVHQPLCWMSPTDQKYTFEVVRKHLEWYTPLLPTRTTGDGGIRVSISVMSGLAPNNHDSTTQLVKSAGTTASPTSSCKFVGVGRVRDRHDHNLRPYGHRRPGTAGWGLSCDSGTSDYLLRDCASVGAPALGNGSFNTTAHTRPRSRGVGPSCVIWHCKVPPSGQWLCGNSSTSQ